MTDFQNQANGEDKPYMIEQVVEVVDCNSELPRDECIKVEEERILFVEDDIYKSVETFKEQIPNLPEYVYWILFLRYNRKIISEDEVRFTEETISRLRNAMKEENSYYQKLFEDNSGNLIDCSPSREPNGSPTTPPLLDIPDDNSLLGVGFN